jgi:CRISPR-associated protein Csm2
MAEQNNNRRDGKDPQKALPPETVPRKVPENYVDEAERIMRALISSGTTVTTSKIRNLLSLVTDIYNDESIRTEDKLKPDSVVKLNLMRVRVAYEYGRDNGESVGKDKVYPMKEFITQAHLREYLKGISTDRADLIRFAHYMEALVAFHRYLGGKEN